MLLMDEPFGALDPVTRVELHAEFRRIQERVKKTVIIVTHDMREAFALADRIGVLDDGPARRLRHAATRCARLPIRVCGSCSTHDARCFAFWMSHRVELAGLLAQHVLLVAVSTIVAVADRRARSASSPRDVRGCRAPIVGLANIVQTIPSLAMFGFLLPVPFIGGVGARAAIVVLILYGLLPIVRTTIAGIAGIDPRDSRGRRRDGHDAAASCCGMSSCRWRCRRSPPAFASPPLSASARRRLPRRSARADSASTSTAACRWWTAPSFWPARFPPRCSRWRSTAGLLWVERQLSTRRRSASRRTALAAARRGARRHARVGRDGCRVVRDGRHRRRLEEFHRAGDSRRARRADDRARHRPAGRAPAESRRHAHLRSRARHRRHRRLRRVHRHGADGRVPSSQSRRVADAVFEDVREQYARTRPDAAAAARLRQHVRDPRARAGRARRSASRPSTMPREWRRAGGPASATSFSSGRTAIRASRRRTACVSQASRT